MQFGNSTPLKEFMNLELGEPFRLDEGEDVREIITSEEDAPEIEGKYIRIAGIDRQKDHFWMVIRDYKPNGDSVLRHASRLETDAELVEVLGKWSVRPLNVIIDTKFAHTDTMKLCAEYGWIFKNPHARPPRKPNNQPLHPPRKAAPSCPHRIVG